MGALCFCCFEVQEADLVPEEGADVALDGSEIMGGVMGYSVDAYALSKAHESAHND